MQETTTYLNFSGNCREAMTFYAKCLGAELHIRTFAEMPGNHPPELKNRIMHSRLVRGSEPILMASDVPPSMSLEIGSNLSICVNCKSAAEVDRLFAAFNENGKVMMAAGDQFWGARFGMLVDQFGIRWMFSFEFPQQS